MADSKYNTRARPFVLDDWTGLSGELIAIILAYKAAQRRLALAKWRAGR